MYETYPKENSNRNHEIKNHDALALLQRIRLYDVFNITSQIDYLISGNS